MELLTTIHGSRLYGTSHSSSDYDLYTVVDEGKTIQTIDALDDRTVVNIHDFIKHVNKGVPQALEALWSPLKTVDESWEAFFNGMVPDFGRVFDTYSKTIYNFYLKDTDKHRLHAMRLSLELRSFADNGKFNPVLNAGEYLVLRKWAETEEATKKFINWTSPVEVWQ